MAMAMRLLLIVSVVVAVGRVVEAQAGPALAPVAPPVISCTLPNTTTISPNYCNAYEEQRMSTRTQACEGFLTNLQGTPSAECCTGLNDVARNLTACICKLAFFPPAEHNASRQLHLPGLCGVPTNLCGSCPTFLVSRLNSTDTIAPAAPPPWSSKPTASAVGAISVAVVFGFLLIGGIIATSIVLIKRRKAKNSTPPPPFETPPPGGPL